MQYIVIERFKDGCVSELYRRFDERGRMLPRGLAYIDSWIAADLRACYQLMQTDDFALFKQWTSQWDDLVDFEIVPVISSQAARARAADSRPGIRPGPARDEHAGGGDARGPDSAVHDAQSQ